jgi:hypothetical protein
MTEKEKIKRAKAAILALAVKKGHYSPTGLSRLAKQMMSLPEDELKKIAGQRSKKKGRPAPHKMRGDPKRVLHKTEQLFEDDGLIDFIADLVTDDPDVFDD